jgi:glycosyltransferase involved in cell wall biosynthesis
VTVVRNGRELLEGTIHSVLDQGYPHIEYVVIDGASTDGTVDLIRGYATRISWWISEPDRDLYDAMNKALGRVAGDFVWMLNAGDRIFEKDTVEKLMRSVTPDIDILFGEVMLVDGGRRYRGTRSEVTTQKLPGSLHAGSLERGMVVSHQGFVPRTSIAPKFISANLSADVDWVIACLKRARRSAPTGLVLAEYLEGGVSKQRHLRSLVDRYRVLKSHYGLLPNLWNHLVILVRSAAFRLRRPTVRPRATPLRPSEPPGRGNG